VPEAVLLQQAAQMIRIGLGETHGKCGWTAAAPRLKVAARDAGWLCRIRFQFHEKSSRQTAAERCDQQWAAIRCKLLSAAAARGWQAEAAAPTVVACAARGIWSNILGAQTAEAVLKPAALSDWHMHFKEFVNRQPQVELLLSAIEAAVQTNFEDRPHVLVYGPPGCGKTGVLRTLQRILPGHCQYFDASALSKAGAEEFLLTTDRVPAVSILDELDKAAPDAGAAWLQVMDDRCEVSKTNATSGRRQRQTKCLVIAAVNDPQRLAGRLGNALFSRLANRIFFPPPTRGDLEAILTAAADKSGIDRRCVPRVLDYAVEAEGATQCTNLGKAESGCCRRRDP
jgi:hypothetical protein